MTFRSWPKNKEVSGFSPEYITMLTKSKHITINGTFHSAEEPSLMPSNRSFCYGDALFETMHAYQDHVQFFSEHFSRLINSMQALSMTVPDYFTRDFLHEQIIALMKKNRLYKGVRVRLTVFRNEGGFYTPVVNDISFLIETTALENIDYGRQPKGLQLGVFENIKKSLNALSSLKSANSLLYVMAGVYAKENNLDDCILLNEHGHIAETISSNIFFVRGNTITTPPLKDACIPGIMRTQIIRIAKEMNFKVDDHVHVLPAMINTSDEIFTTNAVSGIKWVLGCGERRFFHDVSASLLIRLNETAFNSR